MGPLSSAPTPLLSVVIPSHHYGKFISQCLESLRPSPIPLDIIVVENGSRELDDSLTAVVSPHELVLIHRNEADLSTARNTGLQMARGEFVFFLDADDVLDIETVVETLQDKVASRCDAVHFNTAEFSWGSQADDVPLTTPQTHEHSQHKNIARVTTGIEFILKRVLTNTYSPVTGRFAFRREVVNSLQMIFTEGYIHEDHFFVFNFLRNTHSLMLSPHVVLHKRQHKQSLTSTVPSELSITGYHQAALEIRSTVGGREGKANWAGDIAAKTVSTRLLYIAAKKRVRESMKRGNRLTFSRTAFLASKAFLKYLALFPIAAIILASKSIPKTAL